MENKGNAAARLVAGALTGRDGVPFLVNNRRYVMRPPTIRRLAAAGYHLAGYDAGRTMGELLASITDMGRLCKALSCFLKGDESLASELMDGAPEDVVHGLELAYTMLDPQVFIKAVGLARNVASLIAQPR